MTQGSGFRLAIAVALTLALACGRTARRQPAAPPPVPKPADTTQAEAPARPGAQAGIDTSAVAAPPAGPPPPATGAAGEAPAERCIMDFTNREGTAAILHRDPATGKYYSFIGGGIFGKCRNQDITITADSAETYEAQNLYILIGKVHYREPRLAVDAQRMTYYRAEERLVAENAVHAVMQANGATLDGPRVDYYRAVQGIRTQPRIVAVGRPKLTYVEKDSLGRPQPPVVLYADQVVGEGDSTFSAVGKVEMLRGEVVATGDSGYVDATRNFARLMRKPVVESKGTDPYTLRGRVIDMYGAGRTVDRVLAVDSATAVSRDFTVSSDTIDLRMKDNRLDRAFAFGPAGAQVHTPERDVIADSLDIIMPGQHIRELRAIGKAYAESDPDTTLVASDRRDWLRGDTVVAQFDSIAPADTTTKTRIRQLIARGQASAFYQMRAENQPKTNPALNYVRGAVIQLDFTTNDSTRATEVSTVTVVDKAQGIYLTPADTTKPPGKPAGKPPVRRPPP